MATQLSEEETNHLRMSSLLLTIAPRAVRTLFDGIFPPSGLQTVLNMEKAALENLKKKKIINQAQWNLLYGTSTNIYYLILKPLKNKTLIFHVIQCWTFAKFIVEQLFLILVTSRPSLVPDLIIFHTCVLPDILWSIPERYDVVIKDRDVYTRTLKCLCWFFTL